MYVSTLTSIQFNLGETEILNKEFNYNSLYTNKLHIICEIVSAEATIMALLNQELQKKFGP